MGNLLKGDNITEEIKIKKKYNKKSMIFIRLFLSE